MTVVEVYEGPQARRGGPHHGDGGGRIVCFNRIRAYRFVVS